MLSETDASALRVLEERLAMPAASETPESLALILAAEFREFGSCRDRDLRLQHRRVVSSGRARAPYCDPCW